MWGKSILALEEQGIRELKLLSGGAHTGIKANQRTLFGTHQTVKRPICQDLLSTSVIRYGADLFLRLAAMLHYGVT